MPFSKVELYAAIRHDARAEELSSRALSAKYGVGRRTVALALESVWPAPRKQLPPRISRLDAFKATIDEILREDLDAPRKQRHTVKRVFDRLIDEHDARGVTYSMVRACISGRRPEIRVEEGRGPPQAFVPQTHRPAEVLAEADSRPSARPNATDRSGVGSQQPRPEVSPGSSGLAQSSHHHGETVSATPRTSQTALRGGSPCRCTSW
ncbi:hypothetical protein [Streptomyces sp. NBC_00986]|uniref:hypothetical protein n=1 Tax=Streptomyces sp. NBC_00986 TaxID=2903702 RepID=UPI00386E1383|nr:hypothetical protein OG504_03850 [Streptomyces sp. NBC_00986]